MGDKTEESRWAQIAFFVFLLLGALAILAMVIATAISQGL